MVLPSALFVGSPDMSPLYVIEKVIGNSSNDAIVIDSNITAYKWHIDNKYYETDINLCALNSKAISDGTFAESVEAVIICFDSGRSDGLETVESWLPFLEVYDADIKILVCVNCPDDINEGAEGICKRSAQEWCVERGFELVELDPNEEIDPDDDFPETTGVERIRQALNAHQWPNLILKNDASNNANNGSRLLPPPLAESLEELLDTDDFSDLFSQLSEMKARVATLTGADRRLAAEQVVMAFWEAMGGDTDELDLE